MMGATLLALTAAQPTFAADVPIYRKAPLTAAVPFSWGGCYVGGHVWWSVGSFEYHHPGLSG